MKKTKLNSDHYFWGEKCSGWHLINSNELSIIEELMPSNTQEKKHYHNLSQQFFYILNGTATFKIEDEIIEVNKREGLHIKPRIKHQIMNLTHNDLEFLVISQPTSKGDRINQVK